MVTWVPCAGATLHLPSGPLNGSGKHLFIVLNDPKTFDNYGRRRAVSIVYSNPCPNCPAAQNGKSGDSGNLIVQGDNLHALKALLPRYAGR
jgi:hypothetical protein